jgi:hypothetical protein
VRFSNANATRKGTSPRIRNFLSCECGNSHVDKSAASANEGKSHNRSRPSRSGLRSHVRSQMIMRLQHYHRKLTISYEVISLLAGAHKWLNNNMYKIWCIIIFNAITQSIVILLWLYCAEL